MISKIISEIEQCTSYAQKYQVLKKYGTVHLGSSRMCLVIGNKVLKVARNNYGYLQNEHEYNVYTGSSQRHTKHLAKIYDWHYGFSWLVQEKINTCAYKKSTELFEQVHTPLVKVVYHYDLVEADIKAQMGLSRRGIPKCYDYGYSYQISKKY